MKQIGEPIQGQCPRCGERSVRAVLIGLHWRVRKTCDECGYEWWAKATNEPRRRTP